MKGLEVRRRVITEQKVKHPIVCPITESVNRKLTCCRESKNNKKTSNKETSSLEVGDSRNVCDDGKQKISGRVPWQPLEIVKSQDYGSDGTEYMVRPTVGKLLRHVLPWENYSVTHSIKGVG